MRKSSRVSLIGVLSIGVLVLPVGASAQQRPPVADQIAQAYGFGSFSQVDAIRYTFTLDGGPKLKITARGSGNRRRTRSPSRGRTSPARTSRSPTSAPSSRARTPREGGGRSRLLQRSVLAPAPVPFIWDTGPTIEDAGMQKLPLGKGKARKVVVKYPSGGGYLPGDTWELFVGTDMRIREMSSTTGATRSRAWWSRTGPPTRWPGRCSSRWTTMGRPTGTTFRLTFTNVAVKLAGSDTWVEPK